MADQGTLTPLPFWQVFDDDGNPLDGALLYTYSAGTTTPLPTYSDPDLDPIHALTNPIQADGGGRFVPIYLSPTSYRFVLKTSSGATVQTIDPVKATPSNEGGETVLALAGEALSAGDYVYCSDGSGSKTPGRWYKTDADFDYASSLAGYVGQVVDNIASGSTGDVQISGQATSVLALTPGQKYYVSATAGQVTNTAPANARYVGEADSITTILLAPNPLQIVTTNPLNVCEGVLTLTTLTPYPVADVNTSTNVFFTPYTGNRIALYDGVSKWNVRTFSEITIPLGTLTSGKPYDLFAYDNAGAVTFDSPVAWTSSTVRATALTKQDGVYVKTAATTRRYIGSFYTVSTTQTADSKLRRLLDNYYNRVPRTFVVTDTTNTWAYTLATYQQANANTANQVDVMIGVAEKTIDLRVVGVGSNGAGSVLIYTAIGEDATNAKATNCVAGVNSVGASQNTPCVGFLSTQPAEGYHFYAWIEASGATNTTTWVGDNGGTLMQTGMVGTVK